MQANLMKKIRRLSKKTKQILNAEYLPEVDVGLTGYEGALIVFLVHKADKSPTAKDIQEEFHLSKSSVSEALSALESKGYLKLVASKEDGRKKDIVLTDLAYQHAEKAGRAIARLEKRLVEGIDPAKLAIYEEVTDLMLTNLGGKQ